VTDWEAIELESGDIAMVRESCLTGIELQALDEGT
jgi:hypothetical protein